MRQTMAKRKPATETCLFCGQVIPDKNAGRCGGGVNDTYSA